ncbi:lyase family protein [Streptomyces sp. NPDC048297]|uniref:lyase family protein n=1 Tax=Streptomyces sp. NPDC048297 TaxID=3365531 RepID=UPI00372474D5
MTSAESPPAWADAGLLTPGRVGTPVETATGDVAVLQAMLDAEAALTRAQAAVGQAPPAAAEAVTAAARAERFDLRDLATRARAGGNPVIPLVSDLTSAVPAEAAPFVHRGATSQDIMDTAMVLMATRAVPLILTDLHRAADALAALARDHRDTPMPGRTLTQHAVPTTFGLKAAGWRSLTLDAADRLSAVRLPAQLGGAAGTLAALSPLPSREHGKRKELRERKEQGEQKEHEAREERTEHEGREELRERPDTAPALHLLTAYAAELGLPSPDLPWHTLRTPVADLANALAFTACALGKLAADVLLLSRTEIGELAEGAGGGSSTMPHKANPVRATLVAAAARQAPALAATLLGSLVAEDERPAGAWHAEWQPLRALLRLTGGAARAAAELTETVRVFPDRMLDNLHLTRGLIVSERLVAELGEVLGRQEAKHLLTRAAHRASAESLSLDDALSAELSEVTEPARPSEPSGPSESTKPTKPAEPAEPAADPALAGRLAPHRLSSLLDPTDYLGAAAALVDRALARTPNPPSRNTP